jgi:hypothetical protein
MTFDQWYDLYTNPFQTPLKMITISKCAKPNCDCLERAEKANGGPLKHGCQCLYNTYALNAAKEKSKPSPSLPETEQAIDPAEARRNIPDGMDEWCEAHQSYYKYECPECAILAPPDQPVPEEVMDSGKNKAFIELVRDMRPEQALRVAAYIDQEILSLRTGLSSTKAERDSIKQAFDQQAEEMKKYRNQ